MKRVDFRYYIYVNEEMGGRGDERRQDRIAGVRNLPEHVHRALGHGWHGHIMASVVSVTHVEVY